MQGPHFLEIFHRTARVPLKGRVPVYAQWLTSRRRHVVRRAARTGDCRWPKGPQYLGLPS